MYEEKFKSKFYSGNNLYHIFIFMGIAFIIGYSIDKHTEAVDSIEMHLLLERLSHDEKNMGYDREILKSLVELKGGEAIRIEEHKFFVEGEKANQSIRVAVYNPEGYIRATTALEGIYERLKGQLSEESEE